MYISDVHSDILAKQRVTVKPLHHKSNALTTRLLSNRLLSLMKILVGGVAQWLGCRPLAVRLSLIYG